MRIDLFMKKPKNTYSGIFRDGGAGSLAKKRYRVRRKKLLNKENMLMMYIKDIVILLITTGVLILLGIIIIGDYWVAVKEDRPIDDSIIVLMKMSVTGLIGVIGGYIGGSK